MEFKCSSDKNKTPQSKPSVFSSNNNCDSHLKFLPNFSTPPSKFTKIVNPFERRLINRLHLPTFSPSVFGTVSTPKSEEKFKWTIDDISSLKPADIDEATISQHVLEEDPFVESIVQQKIDEFFNEKVIVPSPMVNIVRVPLITDNSEHISKLTESKEFCEGSTQTVLSLPPILPAHIEEILKPYFLPSEEPKNVNHIDDMKNTSLFKNLFHFEKDTQCSSEQDSLHSISPLSGKGVSPIASPVKMNRRHSLPFEMDCSLSPIGRKASPKVSRSACRLDFSSKMSLDASLIVPDICNNESNTSGLLDQYHISLNERLHLLEKAKQEVNFFGFQFNSISFANYATHPSRLSELISTEELQISEFDNNKLEDVINKKTSYTDQNYMKVLLRRQLIIDAAKHFNCKFVFTPEISVDIASSLLSNISLGRGSQVGIDVGFCDDRDSDVKILRPLRQFDIKELAIYNKLNNLEPLSVRQKDVNPYTSVQDLMKKFVTDLQVNYPATVATILRTGDKLSINRNGKTCTICKGPIPPAHDQLTSDQSTTFSHLVSTEEPNYKLSRQERFQNISDKFDQITTEKEDMCYACFNIVNSIKNKS